MNDEMSDLAPALLMAVIVAISLVAFEFRSAFLAKPAHTIEARLGKAKSSKASPQLAMTDRLYWIR
jgi:hypothetical protein